MEGKKMQFERLERFSCRFLGGFLISFTSFAWRDTVLAFKEHFEEKPFLAILMSTSCSSQRIAPGTCGQTLSLIHI